MTDNRLKALAVIAVLGALLLATAPPAAAGKPAKELPFSATLAGTGVMNNPDPVAVAERCEADDAMWITTSYATGNATHLGRIEAVAEHCSGLFTYGEGVIEITAANGDVLLGTYTNGVFDDSNWPPILGFSDEFTFVDGGTGRFVEASGGGDEAGFTNLATGETTVFMEGVISYDASNRSAK